MKSTDSKPATAPVAKPAVKKPLKPIVKKLAGEILAGVSSTAPSGFRELKPGKQICFGPKTFSASKFFQEKKGDSEKVIREKQKNRYVPETVIKQLKLDDKRGNAPALSDGLFL